MLRLVVVLAAAVVPALLAPSAAAQVATPPLGGAAACRHPGLPPGTPTPADATPAAADAAPEAASATPPAEEGAAADQATIDRVLAAELNLFACFNTGDFLGAAALYTPEALLENLGVANPYDLPGLIGGDDTQTVLISIEDVRVLPDGRIRYEDRYRFGDTVYHDLNYLVERDGFLLLARTFPLAAEPATATPAA